MGRGNNSKGKSGSKLRNLGSHRPKRHSRNEEKSEEQEGRDQYSNNEWVIDITKSLDEGHTCNSGRSWTIYRVPNNLCEVYKNAFQPTMISIGPFHYWDRKERLRVMEEHKMRFLERLLGGKLERRKSDGDPLTLTKGKRESDDREREDGINGGRLGRRKSDGDLSSLTERKRESDVPECEDKSNRGRMAKMVLLDALVKAMQKLETKTRACYSEKFDQIHSKDFVWMMVVDGCFVVELLRLYNNHVRTKSTGEANVADPIFTTHWMLRTLQRELLMLENQLPLFVLKKVFELTNNNDDQQAESLETLAVTFFNPLLPRKKAAYKSNTTKPNAHLLAVFRSTFLQLVKKKNNKDTGSQLNPNDSMNPLVQERQLEHFALRLQEAGMQFLERKGDDLLDIGFADGTLLVPQLSINDNTIRVFLNFVAYEQCHSKAKPFFTNYFLFWDALVNSWEDIRILHSHGIVSHVFGGHGEVADLLKQLCREIVYDFDWNYLSNEIKEVNDYCKPYYESMYRLWWNNLIRKHLSTVATVLLLLTFIQTFYAVYSYHRPH
ncbi:UPF0481 protein At3g47200 [Eucalyptus grandis]|uniref:Uncharacterized protein n=2 Tax=Eucalyptus grandis TaxID=71139 RepID=A0ACC3KLL0_EUCGR|nr:UPF0481 protein At3g47200 [Eucalyptus grandis]KAK3426919.1 hypothetical protein EUGRSUZ_F03244 [Eucalyptus grandis]